MAASGGGLGGQMPQSEALPPPLAPQSEEKNGKNQPFSANLDFCPLRIAFCPLDAPPPQKKKKKKTSGAATEHVACGIAQQK